ncbi:hypothetical protein [Candidatus Palauibacter sp.]|uniref:hypothetical protein n=1 Tax=Candidatus Palauibacter sp. TaxID=3101350 RepID=UPI003B01CAE0
MSTFEIAVVVGMAVWVILAMVILTILVYGIRMLRDVREPLARVSGAVTDLNERLRPVLRNAEQASDQARLIAARLKRDVDDVSDAISNATESTGRMVELVEERVVEVAALVAVIQEEAEATFVSTASLLRGLRRGSRKVSGEKPGAHAIGDRPPG